MNLIAKSRSPYVSLLLGFLILFTSCVQYDSNEEQMLLKSNDEERFFTDEQIDEIAYWHNVYAENTIALLDASSPDIVSETRIVMTEIQIPEFKKEHIEEFYEEYSQIDSIVSKIRTNYSPEVSYFFDKMENVISTAKHYEDIVIGFDEIESEAKEVLQGRNVDYVLGMLKVGKKSAKLWMPKSIGGNGIGEKFINEVGKTLNKNSYPQWAVIMINDMGGALQGMSGWVLGILIFGGPVTLGPYLLAIGYSAAVSSIIAAMN